MSRASLVLLNAIVGVASVGVLLIYFIWRNEPWASSARTGLLVVGLSAIGLLSRPGAPGFFPKKVLSPKWRRVGTGLLILLAIYPWSFAVALGIRLGLLPDNIVTGAVLLAGIAALLITGLNIVIRGLFGERP